MNAEIHAKDYGKKDSEGQTLTMQGVHIETEILNVEGLPIGEPRERFKLVIRGEVEDGSILRKLHLELYCHEIDTIIQAAAQGGMLPTTGRGKVLQLLSELHTAVAMMEGDC